ncbi:MAG: MFS transporter [Anaerolineae bacterium]|nr:MFS transporter [Anaerolineae bacterium]
MPPKLPAYPVFLILSGGAAFFLTIWSFITGIYRVEDVGLTPFQLIMLGTALEMAVLIFEIPTGIVADLRSRRLSVIIGYFIMGIGFFLEGWLPFFLPILLAQVIWGFGYTFTSGAKDAWLADEIGESRLTQAYLRASQVALLATLLGLGVSMGLGSIRHNLPMLVGGVGMVLLALFLGLFMPETGFKPTPQPDRSSWQKMGHTFREGVRVVRGRNTLILIMVIAILFGLSSEGRDRLWQAHLLLNFTFPQIAGMTAVTWFGVIEFSRILFNLGVTEYIRQRPRLHRRRTAITVQIILTSGNLLTLSFFALTGHIGLAMSAITLNAVLRRANDPLYEAWLNREIPEPQVRATVFSMNGQLNALGEIIGGILMAFVAQWLGIRAALLGVVMLLLPLLALYGVAFRHTPAESVTDVNS